MKPPPPVPGNTDPGAVAEEFRQAARVLFRDSALYRDLAPRIADTPALVALAMQARPGQSAVLMLFGAVHYLVLEGAEHPLSRHYAELDEEIAPDPEIWTAFKGFCGKYRNELGDFIRTGRVQTNELGRSVMLRVLAEWATERWSPPGLAWLELGCSAGLNLAWDHFRMSFRRPDGSGWDRGDADHPVRLPCRVDGAELPAERSIRPAPVNRRLGIELDPPALESPADRHRLLAFVWADHHQRLQRLRHAITSTNDVRCEVQAGDAIEQLPTACAELPEDDLLCVAHTFFTSQLPDAVRDGLRDQLAQVAVRRPLVRLSAEWDGEQAQLVGEYWDRGKQQSQQALAYAHPHGGSLYWLGG